MEGSDKEVEWEWQVGDQGLNFGIPPTNCVALPPSTVVQGCYASWQTKNQPGWVPDLCGKTLEKVKREAGPIQLRDHLSSVGQFGHCLHSWGVLSERSNHCLKMQWNFCLRVC